MTDPQPRSPFSGQDQAAFDAALDAILKCYPPDRKRAGMIPALRLCQERLGHLTPEAMDYVAHRLQVSPAAAREVATFYTMFYTEPCGRHRIDVCTNVSCSLRGAEQVLAYLEAKLGIRAGTTSSDKRVTLREVECLASCGTGPCLQVNEDAYHENLTREKLDALLAGLA